MEVVCTVCKARYARLPAYTCPRCGTKLCSTGCDGCGGSCKTADKLNNNKIKRVRE